MHACISIKASATWNIFHMKGQVVSGLRFQVLDAFRPQDATWSGQVISSHWDLVGGSSLHTSCLVAESTGFTGLGALSLPGFPILPLPSQCVTWQLGCRRLSTTSPP